MGFSASLRRMIVQDPAVAFSCILAGIGITLPIVVPPIRDALSSGEPVQQPKISEVVSGMTGK
ncbi:hypothetical protein KP509_01G088300 [Ceratopteris richardii]|uniref:Uncharacterized protein n=1 Tax=Ceratopteris richardii TaxID=49495 RepID=A0A8T2VIF7_CERRI|nr:hypothetical protein KP509_01G088300 [Ceratopteris richardii]